MCVCIFVYVCVHNIYTLYAYIKGSLVCLSFIYGIAKKGLKYEIKTCDKKTNKVEYVKESNAEMENLPEFE